MKKLFQSILLFKLTFLLPTLLNAQTAEVQLIHNAADPSLDTLDVYVNGILTLDNFSFRSAIPYTALPAGIPLEIGFAPVNSSSVSDTLKSFTVTLTTNDHYVAIINGVLNPANFAINPDGSNTAFDLVISNNMRLVSQTSGITEFVTINGVTDAPSMDLVSRNSATLADNISYGNFSSYASVLPASYYMDVTDANQSTIVSTYTIDLTGLGDSTAVLFTSGFMDTSANQGGAVFGLFAAFANGTVMEFPSTSIAFLQAIHNCADPSADSLDIYALGFLAVDNFRFRTATDYLAVPAGIPLDVGVALGNSASINDTIKNFPVIFENGKNYIAFATGVINPANFAANPDGKSTAFNLLIVDYAKLSAANAGDVDYIGLHGSTDAPTVDVVIDGGGPVVVDNSAYGDITPYIATTAASYIIDVTPGNNNAIIIRSYIADLSTLAGQSAVIFSSGFLNPAANQNGPSYGFYCALKDGTVFPFADVTGIEEKSNNEVLSISPNPSTDFIDIKFNNTTSQKQSLTITNAIGQTVGVYETIQENNSLRIETMDFEKGMYFIKISDGNNVVVKKFLIQ